MFSPFRIPERVRLAASTGSLLALVLASCNREGSREGASPASEAGPSNVAVTSLFPGGGSPPPPDPHGTVVDGNAQAIAEGKRLFDWYNCSGCHFHGAGGIGPSFMDSNWRYGGAIDQIYASIYQGRPNGMPSWAGKIPNGEIWNIAAYVRSLAVIGSTMPMPTSPTPAVPGPGTLETEPGKNSTQ